jgi:hypothetical protein
VGKNPPLIAGVVSVRGGAEVGKPGANSEHRCGYDPTLGIMHESREGSSAFVFDMMEPERPKVDRAIVEFVKAHKFHAADFVIRSDGVCRLNPEMARVVVFMVGTDQALDMMATPMTNTNTLSG